MAGAGAKPSPYDILGLQKDCSSQDIRRAYLKAVRTSHSDRGGDSEQFHLVKEAKEILSDDDLRRAYDMGGYDLVEKLRERKKMMGGMRQQRAPDHVPPVRVGRLRVPLNKVWTGSKVPVPVKRFVITEGGDQNVRLGERTLMNVNVREEEVVVRADVPVGCKDEMTIRIRGEGHRILKDKGDVILKADVEAPDNIQADGPNLMMKVEVGLGTAIFGGVVNVPDVDAPAEVGVPAQVRLPEGLVLAHGDEAPGNGRGPGPNDPKPVMLLGQGLPILGAPGARGHLVMIVEPRWKRRAPTSKELVAVSEAAARGPGAVKEAMRVMLDQLSDWTAPVERAVGGGEAVGAAGGDDGMPELIELDRDALRQAANARGPHADDEDDEQGHPMFGGMGGGGRVVQCPMQ